MNNEDPARPEAKGRPESRVLDPRDSADQRDRRLRWAQVLASCADAIARFADVASRLLR
jgi:hypothetical protein